MGRHKRPHTRQTAAWHWQKRRPPKSSGCALYLLMLAVESLGWW